MEKEDSLPARRVAGARWQRDLPQLCAFSPFLPWRWLCWSLGPPGGACPCPLSWHKTVAHTLQSWLGIILPLRPFLNSEAILYRLDFSENWHNHHVLPSVGSVRGGAGVVKLPELLKRCHHRCTHGGCAGDRRSPWGTNKLLQLGQHGMQPCGLRGGNASKKVIERIHLKSLSCVTYSIRDLTLDVQRWKAAVWTPLLHLLPGRKIQVLARSCYLYDLHAWNSFSFKMFFPLYQLFIEESLCICRILKGSYYFTILIFPAVQIIVLTSQCLEMLFTFPFALHCISLVSCFTLPTNVFPYSRWLFWDFLLCGFRGRSEQDPGSKELVNIRCAVLAFHTLLVDSFFFPLTPRVELRTCRSR